VPKKTKLVRAFIHIRFASFTGDLLTFSGVDNRLAFTQFDLKHLCTRLVSHVLTINTQNIIREGNAISPIIYFVV
jgi:hypothetical protein